MKFRPGRILSRLITLLSLLLAAGVFFLFIVMTAPEEEVHTIVDDQPLTAAADELLITGVGQLSTLLESFPVPVLSSVGTGALTLSEGRCYDVPFEDGVARCAALTYTLDDGRTLTLQSIYPARAVSLIERDGYALVGSVQFAGLNAVRMAKDDAIRLHAQHSEALYVVIAPVMDYGELSDSIEGLLVNLGVLKNEAPNRPVLSF